MLEAAPHGLGHVVAAALSARWPSPPPSSSACWPGGRSSTPTGGQRARCARSCSSSRWSSSPLPGTIPCPAPAPLIALAVLAGLALVAVGRAAVTLRRRPAATAPPPAGPAASWPSGALVLALALLVAVAPLGRGAGVARRPPDRRVRACSTGSATRSPPWGYVIVRAVVGARRPRAPPSPPAPRPGALDRRSRPRADFTHMAARPCPDSSASSRRSPSPWPVWLCCCARYVSSATATTRPPATSASQLARTGGRAALGRPLAWRNDWDGSSAPAGPHPGRGAARRVPATRTGGRQGGLSATASWSVRRYLGSLPGAGGRDRPPRHPLRTGPLRAGRRRPGLARGRGVQARPPCAAAARALTGRERALLPPSHLRDPAARSPRPPPLKSPFGGVAQE